MTRLVVMRLWLLLLVLSPSRCNSWTTRPPPPPKDSTADNKNSKKKQQAKAAAAVVAAIATANSNNRDVLPRKLAQLVGAAVLSYTDTLVLHKLFNETERLALKHEKGNYKKTFLYAALQSVNVGAKAYGVTLAVDLLEQFFPPLRQLLPFGANLGDAAPQLGVLIWGVKSLSAMKHLLLNKLVFGTRLGKVVFIDRLTDFGLGMATLYNVLRILQWEMGVNLNSLFAASGVSAIIFSLASKGMVEQMVGGLLLNAWDAIEVGEHVKLGDGTEGTIVRIGLLETEVLGNDHVPIRVPNSQIVGKRVYMYSKVEQSAFQQDLRFQYRDLPKLPQILEDIGIEIASQCGEKMLGEPKVLLTAYQADHIEVHVKCNFDFKPDSDEYPETRQRALFAIAKAIQKNEVEFALPAIQYETTVVKQSQEQRGEINSRQQQEQQQPLWHPPTEG